MTGEYNDGSWDSLNPQFIKPAGSKQTVREYHSVTKEHCNHECVCNWLACHIHCDTLDEPCPRKECENRSRPLSEHDAEIRMKVLDELYKISKFRLERITDPNIKPEYQREMKQAIFELNMVLSKIESLRGERGRDTTNDDENVDYRGYP